MRRLCLFYKVFHSKVPKYIHRFIPSIRTLTRQENAFTSSCCWTDYFQNSFLPSVIKQWNKLDPEIRSCLSYCSFRKRLLHFIRSSENQTYIIHDQVGIKLLTRLRLEFSRWRKQKFRHNFKGIVNPSCSSSIKVGTTFPFYLRCQFFNDIQEILMNELIDVDKSLPSLSQNKLISLLLCGSDA